MTEEERFQQVRDAFSPFGVTAMTLTHNGVDNRQNRDITVLLPQATIGRRLFNNLVLVLNLNARGNFTNFYVKQVSSSAGLHPHVNSDHRGFCFGNNGERLNTYLFNDQLSDFAALLLTSISRLDVNGGPYRVPTYTYQCPICSEWFDDNLRFERCANCREFTCVNCMSSEKCTVCGRGGGHVCANCNDSSAYIYFTHDEGREGVACRTCFDKLMRGTIALCPTCGRAGYEQFTCAGCGKTACGRCSSALRCESPFHREPYDLQRYITARLNKTFPLYQHYTGRREIFCSDCVKETRSRLIDRNHRAWHLCPDHHESSPNMKQCSNRDCPFGFLPLEYFHSNGHGGHRSECKFCRQQRRQLRRQQQNEQNEAVSPTIPDEGQRRIRRAEAILQTVSAGPDDARRQDEIPY